jgi:hypothetical protein
MTETVNRLYSMPIELRDGNFVGLVTSPFTHEEHLDALRSLGFMDEDIEKWEPPNITEFELPEGFNSETETKRVIHLTANRQVFMVDEDWIEYWPQRTITMDEANATLD